MISLTLDQPPSVNALYTNVNRIGRVKTREYKSWKELVGRQIKAQPISAPCPSPFSAVVRVGKCSQARDLDNFLKPVLDALKDNKIIHDDNLLNVHMAAAVRDFENVPQGKIIIELTPIIK